MFWILSSGPHFKMAFALLAIPAALALGALYVAYKKFPHPEVAEPTKQPFSLRNFPRSFWIFIIAAAFAAAGTLNFAFISFHLQKQAIAATATIPLFYAGAIAISALFALGGGKWFDYAPKASLYFGVILGILSPLFLLLGKGVEVWIGIGLWGVALGTQNALFRSMLAHLIPPQQRSTGYGIFGIVFGLAWFLGGALIGTIYDMAIALSALTSVVLQVLALPFLRKLKINVTQ
jgi:MFS-type transporter involved in bile tolerance (Atg22 family)